MLTVKEQCENMGNEITTNLGLENAAVVSFWSLFELREYALCIELYNSLI